MRQHYGELFAKWEKSIITGIVRYFEEENPWMRYPGHEALLQECFIRWLSARDRFNPERGTSIKAYMRSVVRKRLADIRKEQLAEKRIANHVADSLDEPVSDSGLFLKDIIPDVRGLKADKLRLELVIVIGKLSPFRQRICLFAGHGYSLREIEKKIGIPKSIIHEELQEIRKVFTNEGLDEYLQ